MRVKVRGEGDERVLRISVVNYLVRLTGLKGGPEERENQKSSLATLIMVNTDDRSDVVPVFYPCLRLKQERKWSLVSICPTSSTRQRRS